MVRMHFHTSHSIRFAALTVTALLLLPLLPGGKSTEAAPSSGEGLTVLPDKVIAPFDTVPRFCNVDTTPGGPHVSTAQNGSWFHPATWVGNQVPQENAKVHIQGHSVVYDQQSEVAVRCIEVGGGGRLDFSTTQNTKLRIHGELFILPDGALTMGTVSNPIPASVKTEIAFTNTPIDTSFDPKQYGHGLLAFGDVSIHGAVKNPTFVRMTHGPKIGETVLNLEQAPTGWQIGDRLLVPNTQEDAKSLQFEVVTLQAVNGTSVTIAPALQYNHPGARDSDGTPTVLPDGTKLLPHLANITRNVVIRSEEWMPDHLRTIPTDMRAHTQFFHRAAVDIRYAEFEGLGRTMGGDFENTTFNPDGSVASLGRNQIGRYSVHFHHLFGPRNASNTGYQATFLGNAVNEILKWGLTIHDTSYMLAKGNTFIGTTLHTMNGRLQIKALSAGNEGFNPYATVAHLATEDGNEAENDIEDNFMATGASMADPHYEDLLTQKGGAVAGIWLQGPNPGGRISGNVITSPDDVTSAGIVLMFVGTFDNIPLFRGASTITPGEFNDIKNGGTPVKSMPLADGSIGRTEVYGIGECIHLWDVAPKDNPKTKKHTMDNTVRKLENIIGWHLTTTCIEGIFTANVLVDGVTVRALPVKKTAAGRATSGLTFSTDALTINATVRNLDIQDTSIGVDLNVIYTLYGQTAPGTFTIEDAFLKNATNISVKTMFTEAVSARLQPIELPPKDTFIKNVRFASSPYKHWFGDYDLFMNYDIIDNSRPAQNGFKAANVIQSDRVFVDDWNGQPGNDFQVMYEQQRSDFILPVTDPVTTKIVGCPEANLTNQQCWDTYGVALAGEIAPCMAKDNDPTCAAAKARAATLSIKGLVFPLVGGTLPSLPPKLTISQPSAGSSIQGTTVNVTYTKSGDLTGVDHVHLQLDTNAEVRDLDFDGSYTFTNVPVGSHTLKGYMAKADHSKVLGTDVSVSFTTTTASTSNTAPTVNAGLDQTITLPATASLDGTVSDDGLPNPPGTITSTWSKISGPGTVTFGNANAVDTTASFSVAGTYVLRLRGDDSALSAIDTVSITVNAAPVGGGGTACFALDLPQWTRANQKWTVDVKISLRQTGQTNLILDQVLTTTDANGVACVTVPAGVFDTVPHDVLAKVVPGHLRVKVSGLTGFLQSGVVTTMPTQAIGDTNGNGTISLADLIDLIRAYVTPALEPAITQVLSGTLGQRFPLGLIVDAIGNFRNALVDQ